MKGFSRYTLFLLATWTAGASFSVALAKHSETRTLQILGASAFQGKFRADDARSGGLAATVEYAKNAFLDAKARRDSFLFFHTGTLLPSSNQKEWEKTLFSRNLNLIETAGFSGIALDARETGFLSEMKGPDRQAVPALSFDYRWMHKEDYEENLPPHPYLMLEKGKLNLFVTAITGGPEPEYSSNPWKNLEEKINELNGIDLFIILAPDPLIGGEILKKIFIPKADAPLTFDRPDPAPVRTYLLIGDSEEDRFYRAPSGMHVCEMKAEHLCDIQLSYRDSTLLSVSQAFHRVNDRSYPERTVTENKQIRTFTETGSDQTDFEN